MKYFSLNRTYRHGWLNHIKTSCISLCVIDFALSSHFVLTHGIKALISTTNGIRVQVKISRRYRFLKEPRKMEHTRGSQKEL